MVFPAISKNFKSVIGEIFSGTSVPRPTQHYFRSPKRQASRSLLVMSITFDLYARSQNCSVWKCELKLLNMPAKYFQLFETMCYQYFRKESVLFTPKNMLLERILATLLANYQEDSLDGDSFVSQSRFDAFA